MGVSAACYDPDIYILLLSHGTGADPLVPEGYGQQCTARGFCKLRAHFKGRHLPAVPVQHGILLCDPGAHHADFGADFGAAAQQPRSEGQGHLPHHDLPAVCNLAGFLLHDLQVAVCQRWSGQPGAVHRGHPHSGLVPERMGCALGHRHCAGLALDGLQHGVLSGRSAEH